MSPLVLLLRKGEVFRTVLQRHVVHVLVRKKKISEVSGLVHLLYKVTSEYVTGKGHYLVRLPLAMPVRV